MWQEREEKVFPIAHHTIWPRPGRCRLDAGYCGRPDRRSETSHIKVRHCSPPLTQSRTVVRPYLYGIRHQLAYQPAQGRTFLVSQCTYEFVCVGELRRRYPIWTALPASSNGTISRSSPFRSIRFDPAFQIRTTNGHVCYLRAYVCVCLWCST